MSATANPVGTVADGFFLFSSEDIQIGAVTYFSKNIRLGKQSKKIEGGNSASVVFRKGYIKKGYYSGSATLKYPSVANAQAPDELVVFTMSIPEIATGAAKKYIITSVTPSRGEDSEAVCDIEFDEVLNDPVTVGAAA